MRNKSIIELYINDEKDLYNKFTVSGKNKPPALHTKINDEIIDLIIAETENTPNKNSLAITINLCCQMNSEINAIEKMIKENIARRIDSINWTFKKYNIFIVISAFIGMFLIGVTQFLEVTERRFPLKEFIVVMSWVFMWKAVELIFFDKMKLRRKKRILLKIYHSEIITDRKSVV